MTDLKNILKNQEELNTEELIRYLQGSASEEERFAIEKQMADSDFVNEAVEGLQNFKDPTLIQEYVSQLDKQLQKHTGKKGIRNNKRKIKDQNWLIITILCILALSIAGYMLIHFYTVR